ncbi:hypothetical protein FA95DRAFT_1564676 [Auriscalpium vulgare]|uniref:Uncharacterized protein n=1 Tax=Auriscalpium vulgare TaxID=40419 RepID=A0ACB8RD17_9AGAM|nr:hypothetical protein FA95DRAFT_1564676 [Auriscalpium vulgare]
MQRPTSTRRTPCMPLPISPACHPALPEEDREAMKAALSTDCLTHSLPGTRSQLTSSEVQRMSEPSLSTVVGEGHDLLDSWDTLDAPVMEDKTQADLFVMPDPSAPGESGVSGTQKDDHNNLRDANDDIDGSLSERMLNSMLASMFDNMFNSSRERENRILGANGGDKAILPDACISDVSTTTFMNPSDGQHIFMEVEEINQVRMESEQRKRQGRVEQSLVRMQFVRSLSEEQVTANECSDLSSRIQSWLQQQNPSAAENSNLECAQAQDPAAAQRGDSTEQNPQVDPEEAPVHQYRDSALRTGAEEGDKIIQGVHHCAERAEVEVACPATPNIDIQYQGPVGKRDAHTRRWQTFVVCFATLTAVTLFLLWWCHELTLRTTSLAKVIIY